MSQTTQQHLLRPIYHVCYILCAISKSLLIHCMFFFSLQISPILAVSVAICWCLLVCMSRLYLGVHSVLVSNTLYIPILIGNVEI